AHPKESVSRLLGRGRLIEYWAHEACLLPADDWPLFRPAMQDGGRRWYGEIDRTHPHLREHVVAERQGFQRLYDLPERVLDSSLLDAASPSEPERLRELALRAVRARGALT